MDDPQLQKKLKRIFIVGGLIAFALYLALEMFIYSLHLQKALEKIMKLAAFAFFICSLFVFLVYIYPYFTNRIREKHKKEE